jgi:hypothetical protein
VDRRGRHAALLRRSIGIGIAVSIAVHALALALARFRVDPQAVRPDATLRWLRVEAPPRVETVRPPELIRIREPEALTVAVPAPALPDLAAVPEPAPQLAGTPLDLDLDAPTLPVVATPSTTEGPGTADDPLGVPLYEPGAVGKVKRGWLTAAGLNPRGAAVAVWVVGCPAPRTIVTSDPKPTYRGRPCH